MFRRVYCSDLVANVVLRDVLEVDEHVLIRSPDSRLHALGSHLPSSSFSLSRISPLSTK